MASDKPTVFISYSHLDEEWKDRLVKHLTVLEGEGFFEVWEDRRIGAGEDWNAEIESGIEQADVAIFLISADFLISKYIRAKEVPELLERREKDGVKVVPLILKHCPWKKIAWLSPIQVRPKDGRPLAEGDDNQIDADLSALAEEIHEIFHPEDAQQAATPMAAPPVATARPSSPRLGSIVHKLVDRLRQVNAFDVFFWKHMDEGTRTPQVFVLPGGEGEAHDSFMERLIKTRVAEFSQKLWGTERGAVRAKRVPWPEVDDLDLQQRNLSATLFREFDPSYMGRDLSVRAFSRLPAFSLVPIVVIQHRVACADWEAKDASLIRWYVDEYWGTLVPSSDRPQFLVFLKMVYPKEEPRRGLSRLFGGRPFDPTPVRESLERVARDPKTRCPTLVFDDLQPITLEQLKAWFDDQGIYSEKKRRQLAEALFAENDTMSMEDIEEALEGILEPLRDQQVEQEVSAL